MERSTLLQNQADEAEDAWETLSLDEYIDFGRYYFNHKDGEEKALQWFLRAAKQEGLPVELMEWPYLVRRYVYTPEEPQEMTEELAAESVDRRKIDSTLVNEAMYLLDDAAKDGNIDAQRILAFCYEHGLGVPQNCELAERYAEMAEGGLIMCKITYILGDITKLDVDAIVNAAKSSLLGGGGVDGAIHRAAGPKLLDECRTLGGCPTGEAKITKGYNLPAKHVIHTVGPIYSGNALDPVLLESCYRNSLDIARENDLHSVAFPAISCGVYGYPWQEASEIACRTIAKWLKLHPDYDMEVTICCFSQEMHDIYEKILTGR